MATVIRGPLYVGNRSVEPFRLATLLVVVPSLLCTVLAQPLAIPLPVSAAHSFPLQVQVKPGLFPNADTSHGTPKTLLEELRTAPFVVLQQSAIDRAFAVIDTSRGTPATLFPVAVVPLPTGQQAPTPLVDRIRQVTDTSQSQPATLGVVPLPSGNVGWVGLPRYGWQVTDSSRGTAKALLPEIRDPFVVLQQGLIDDPVRFVVDTSQGLALKLTAAGSVDRVVTVPPANITFAGLAPTIINTSVVVEALGGIGGRHEIRRHRRIVVEIDGELFEVRSEQEGIKLLQQARELAQATADHAATAAVAKAEKSRRPQARARALAMRVPTLKLVDADYTDADVQRMQAQVDAARIAIEETYARAMRVAQAAFIANRDRDEEDTVAALLFDAHEEEALVRELIDRLGTIQGKRKTTKGNNERS